MDDPDLAGLVPSWMLELRAAGKSKGTLKIYEQGVRVYVRWCAERDDVPVLGRTQVMTYMADSMDRLNSQPSTMRSHLTGLKSFSAWCAREGELPADEIAGLAAPKLGSKFRPLLSTEQVSAMLATCDPNTFTGKRDKAIIQLMIDCGGRAEEIIGLTVAEMSVTKGRALIHGKGNKDRLIPFRPETAAAIDRYLRARRRHKRASSDVLWLGDRNQGFGYSALSAMIKRRGALAGIEYLHPHMFRRTFADMWLSSDGSEDGLMAIAGWADRSMIKHYAGARANIRALDEHQRLFGGP